MKRWARRICMFLLLGAIVNIAVVVLVVFVVRRLPDDRTEVIESRDAGVEWRVRLWNDPTFVAINSKRMRRPEVVDASQDPASRPIWVGSGDIRSLPLWAGSIKRPTTEFARGDIDIEERVLFARGWPCVSMWLEVVDLKGGPAQYDVEGGWKLSDSWDDELLPLWMPYRPAIVGFAVNTVFYAAILWMLFALPFALRRRLRVKRGLCPKCAYPIGASDVCTECGTSLSSLKNSG